MDDRVPTLEELLAMPPARTLETLGDGHLQPARPAPTLDTADASGTSGTGPTTPTELPVVPPRVQSAQHAPSTDARDTRDTRDTDEGSISMASRTSSFSAVEDNVPPENLQGLPSYVDNCWNNFEGVSAKGLDDVAKMGELLTFFKARADLEREHAVQLSALGKKARKDKGPFLTEPVYARMLPALELEAALHQDVAQRIQKELCGPLQAFMDQFDKFQKEGQKEGRKAHQTKKEACDWLTKRKQKYLEAAGKLAIAETTMSTAKGHAVNEKEIQKLQKELEKGAEELNHHLDKYKLSVSEWNVALDKTQQILQMYEEKELERMRYAMETVSKYVTLFEGAHLKLARNFLQIGYDLDNMTERDGLEAYIATSAPEKERELPAEVHFFSKDLMSDKQLQKLDAKKRRVMSKQAPLPKVTANTRIFGVSLEEAMSRPAQRPDQDVPWMIEEVCQGILDLGATTTQGIFRVPGDVKDVARLKQLYDSGSTEGIAAMKPKDVFTLTSLLKLYFRELPEPLIPQELYQECVHATAEEAGTILARAPPINRKVIKFLVTFIADLARPETVAVTLMDAENLAMVWAPSFLRNPSMNPLDVMTNLSLELRFVLILLQAFRGVNNDSAAAAEPVDEPSV